MKRLKVLTALAMGIMASTSGVVQVKAATYNYFVDFDTKEVDNFDDYRQTFFDSTDSLGNAIRFFLTMSYKLDSCPTNFTIDFQFQALYRVNDTGAYTSAIQELPNGTCTTSYVSYGIEVNFVLPDAVLAALVDDDANFITFVPNISILQSASTNGRTITYAGMNWTFTYFYQFNTTYLFNIFLSDQKYQGQFYGGWSSTGTEEVKLNYVLTTAGNDEYRINNTGDDIGVNRKKYAIDYNGEFFRGESVGSQFAMTRSGTVFSTLAGSGRTRYGPYFNYYYLNTANLSQEIVDAPIFDFEEEDCGNFLALNVGCFINNAFAYITNDAPIVSDAFTLLNAGIEMAAQTFGIIGEFADDNVFGVLILAGFGFIAVKWFLKND
jgi:hypothetical protein